MAKKEAAKTESSELALTNANAWMVPETGEKSTDLAGTEDIGLDEIRLPRLGIAQGLSPQITPDSSSYIENLKLFDLFNDLTGTVYGRGPIHFVPCHRAVRRIEFKPREEGGGVVDLDVPANDPRTQWTKDEAGERQPPVATKFIEFVVLLLREGVNPEPIVLSIKDTNKWNRQAATGLSSFIKLRQDAIYGGIYTIASKSEKNDNGTFGVYVVRALGKAAPAVREMAKQFHDSLQGKTIVVDREPGSDDFEPGEADDAPPM